MKNTNNNRLIYTGVLLAATLSFGQAVQAAPLILGGNQTISTDTNLGTDAAVVVGNSDTGNGNLTVNNGATLTNSSSNPTFISQIGGIFYFRGNGYLGFNTGSTGTATVTGANSVWQNSHNLLVGYQGNGTLHIENGGKVTHTAGNAGGVIGQDIGSTGTATVTGANSIWQNQAELSVGSSGNGTLKIENGGRATSSTGHIGLNSGSTGTATVTGANSRWENSGTLYVGNFGQGALNIEDGGKVTNNNSFIGYGIGSTGTATVTGVNSRWENLGKLYIGGDASGARGSGSFTIDDGGVVSAANGVTIWSTGSLSGNGGTLDGDVVNRGLIDPTEVFTITGDLTLTETSILALDIFGPTVYDQLFIGGDFFIDGLLTLDFDGFTQSAFDTTYDLIHIGGDITGAWGDFDINVDGFDSALLGYSIVGSSVDGYSRALRLTIAGTGDTGGNPGGPGDNTVPEPASILLIGLGGLAMLMLRRRSPRISLV